MVGPILSVLMMGMLPVSGLPRADGPLPALLTVARPVQRGAEVAVTPSVAPARRLSASGYVVMDLESGQTLLTGNPEEPRAMASLTKLMTALLIVENHGMDGWVEVPEDVYDPEVTMLHLPPGQEFTVGDLLKALLIGSSNEAAVTLARHHAGTVEAFAQEMNARARELGLKKTKFANPTGFDAPEHHASPHDLAWLAAYVLRKKEIASRMSQAHTSIVSRAGETVDLTHTHQLLRPGGSVVAGKTGTTDEAGQCLLSIVNVRDRRYVVVLLRSGDRYADMRSLLASLSALPR